MKQYKILSIITGIVLLIISCAKDLDVTPIDPNLLTTDKIFSTPEGYKMALAKLYAGLNSTGQQGPAGDPDIKGIDEGFSSYTRQLWCAQELSTDEAVIAWNDVGVKDFHNQNWTSANVFVSAMYNRIFFQVTNCNEFIRQVNGKKGSLSDTMLSNVNTYIAEARFLRAFSYFHAIDMYGNVPFVTEKDKPGAYFPTQTTRAKLFDYVESELLAIENELGTPKSVEYGRVDQAAAWMLLAKLYLNAEVYIKKPKYTECITYCNKVINSGYTLDTAYQDLFLSDNNKSPEIIFAIESDGKYITSYGNTNFIIHAEVGGKMKPKDYGIEAGWGGLRVTPEFVAKFADPTGATDKRAMFFTNGQTLDIADISLFTSGYAVTKFKNITSAGVAGSVPGYTDTDLPVFRLADAYLMYAEAVLRGGSGGDNNTALLYVNKVIERAYKDNTHDIGLSQLTLDFIFNERARELFWECHRRTDLIRYGSFTNNSKYLWQWKGGVKAGIVTDSTLNIFPLPASDINSNPNLTQNPGY
jgi:starch-binding outer membrane protein, SusD/RagB family